MKSYKFCLFVLLFVSLGIMAYAQQSAFQGTWYEEYFKSDRLEISGNNWSYFVKNDIKAAGTARFSTGKAELLLVNGEIYFRLTLLAPGYIEAEDNRQIITFRLDQPKSQNNSSKLSPMSSWEFTSPTVILNNKKFNQNQYAESWKEQEGVAIVQGIKRNYWLYDSYSYHDGSADDIYFFIIPAWIENMGYVIDYDNIEIFNPNLDLASSVKILMSQKGCDISFTLVTDIGSYHYVIINNFNRDTGIYDSIIYPLYKK
jgi:hypothetical protein